MVGHETYRFDLSRNLLEIDARSKLLPNFRVHSENPETVDRGQRLRSAVRAAGGNKRVSEISKVPISTIGAYIAAEREWSVPKAIALANACNVDLQWLLTGEGRGDTPSGENTPQEDTIPTKVDSAPSFIPIPRYDVRASAGTGLAVIEEHKMGYIAVEPTFFRTVVQRDPRHLVSLQADGDSMEPTIRDGDVLVVDTSVTDVRNSRVYVLDVAGRLMVKRIQLRLDGSLVIKSDNAKYEPETVTPSERMPLRIIGEVVYQAGPVRS